MIGNLAESSWFRHDWRRRIVAGLLAAVFALLSLFPQQYRMAVSLSPTDPSSLGLGGALGQLGAVSGAFGSQAAIEVGLRIGRSQEVRKIVIQNMDLVRARGFSNEREADHWLEQKMDIRVMRGGILQIEVKDGDSAFGLKLVSAYADAIRTRLSQLSREQTAYKRRILSDLVGESTDRLTRAQEAYDSFRRGTRYAEPASAIGAIGGRVAQLQGFIKAKQVDLATARAFATDNNMAVRQIIAEIEVLKDQLREAQSLDSTEPYAMNRVIVQTTQIQKLTRELGTAQSLYDSYKRFLEGTSVEDLASTGNTRIIEPPYVDTARQFRPFPAAMFLLIILLAVLVEFYLMRPPIGAVRSLERHDQ